MPKRFCQRISGLRAGFRLFAIAELTPCSRRNDVTALRVDVRFDKKRA
jgi:hypothetical protein